MLNLIDKKSVVGDAVGLGWLGARALFCLMFFLHGRDQFPLACQFAAVAKRHRRHRKYAQSCARSEKSEQQ